MLRAALLMFVVSASAVWGQTTPSTATTAEKVDKATAYYHFMLAHMYTEMDAATGGRNPEYADLATENYKAALKADPQAPPMKTGPRAFYIRRAPAPSPPTPAAPKTNP